MQSKLKPKHKPPDDIPGSGSGVIRFTDLSLTIRQEALVIARTYPGLSLTQSVAAAIEEAYERRRTKALAKKVGANANLH